MTIKQRQLFVIGNGDELDLSTYEVDTDGGNVALGVGVVGKTQKQTRFTDTGISDQQQLEQVITVI